MKKDKYYITVAGNIATGKTNLVKFLAKTLGLQPFLEDVESHPYLLQYYEDMRKWAFHSQLYFLLQAFKQQLMITKDNISACQERSIYEHFGVFITSLYEQNILESKDYEMLREVFSIMNSLVRKPDLLICLQASPLTLIQRVKSRNRDFERGMTYEYVEYLNKRYTMWLETFDVCPTLPIDTEGLSAEQVAASILALMEKSKTQDKS